MSNRWDETWHRLRDWTNGQGPSERLAAQILLSEDFNGLDPSHPLGGPDRGKDATTEKGGRRWVMAVYFPRGQQSHSAIKQKFLDDLRGVPANGADGIAFLTNQELTLAEREELANAACPVPVELYHLERITAILDKPAMADVRRQFLSIEPSEAGVLKEVELLRNEMLAAQRRLEGLQTGGDSFCYWMLYHFDMEANVARNFVIIRKGEFPLYDLRLRIVDMDASPSGDIFTKQWGELNSPADYLLLKWPLREIVYYRVFFHARNGSWHQDLQLRKSPSSECWLAATRVVGRRGEFRIEHIDQGFVDQFGGPVWRG